MANEVIWRFPDEKPPATDTPALTVKGWSGNRPEEASAKAPAGAVASGVPPLRITDRERDRENWRLLEEMKAQSQMEAQRAEVELRKRCELQRILTGSNDQQQSDRNQYVSDPYLSQGGGGGTYGGGGNIFSVAATGQLTSASSSQYLQQRYGFMSAATTAGRFY